MKDKTLYLLDIGIIVISGLSLLIIATNTFYFGKEFPQFPAMIFGILGLGTVIRVITKSKNVRYS